MSKDYAEAQHSSSRRRWGALVLVAVLAASSAWAFDLFKSGTAPEAPPAPPPAPASAERTAAPQADQPAPQRQRQSPPAAPSAPVATDDREAAPPDQPPPSRRRLAAPPPRPVGDYIEGEDYYRLANQQPSSARQIEVIEFFWYGCPHCALFEPHLRRWVERQQPDVRFSEVPAIWRSEMEAHARAYYTAKALGRLDDIHGALLNALALQQQPLHTASALADFFAKAGVPREDFDRAWSSFSVARAPARAKQSMRAHGIGATPSMVVAGEYQVRATRDMEKMLDIVDYLVARERYARYLEGQALRERAQQAAEDDAWRNRAAPEPLDIAP